MNHQTKKELKEALEKINMAILAIREELRWETEIPLRLDLMARQNRLLARESELKAAYAAL